MPVPPGISLAPFDTALTVTPAWQRVDLAYNVQSWQIDRGRANEMSRTGTGTASFTLIDTNGDFDPTNPAGAYYGLGPLDQAMISLQNPVTGSWLTLFRGFVSRLQWQPNETERFATVTVDLVDGLAFLAACEMVPDGSFGNAVIEGNIVFNEDDNTNAVQTRMNLVLDQAHWPAALRNLFTGNVWLSKSVYSPRSTVLQVLQDAADGEFPDVANVFIGGPPNPGQVVFHGRLARFDPASYGLHTWQVGDDAAAAANPAGVIPLSPPLVASIDDTLLYTSALATPQYIADADIAGQYVQDATTVAQKGLRTWSAENLATFGGVSTNALQETHKFADYIKDNYLVPRIRVGQLTVKGRRPSGPNGAASWNLLCNIDISDVVHVKTTHGGGGGFDTDFYVEGIHYQARPGGGSYPVVELTLDVSPKAYYDTNPF